MNWPLNIWMKFKQILVSQMLGCMIPMQMENQLFSMILKAVNAGTKNIMTRMEERGLGVYDDVAEKFKFQLYYYSNFRVTAAITLATLDMSAILLSTNIGDSTTSDSDKFNDINASALSLQAVKSALASFNDN
jgi:hypothetical protein